jgi:hypothetical protein
MAARTRKVKLSDAWREKIRIAQIINRLAQHVDGEVELKSTQIKAAEILLKKVVPDMARTEVVGDDEQPLAIKVVSGIDE